MKYIKLFENFSDQETIDNKWTVDELDSLKKICEEFKNYQESEIVNGSESSYEISDNKVTLFGANRVADYSNTDFSENRVHKKMIITLEKTVNNGVVTYSASSNLDDKYDRNVVSKSFESSDFSEFINKLNHFYQKGRIPVGLATGSHGEWLADKEAEKEERLNRMHPIHRKYYDK